MNRTNNLWTGPDSRARWKRIALIVVILALCAGFVIGKPLLFPQPLPPEPPVPMPTIDIEYNEHYFDSILGRYGVRSLGYLCNASSPETLRLIIHLPFSNEQLLLEVHGDQLLKYAARFDFNNTETQTNRVVSSISSVLMISIQSGS